MIKSQLLCLQNTNLMIKYNCYEKYQLPEPQTTKMKKPRIQGPTVFRSSTVF